MTYTPYGPNGDSYMSANEEKARRELHEGTDWDNPDDVAGFYECSRDLDKIYSNGDRKEDYPPSMEDNTMLPVCFFCGMALVGNERGVCTPCQDAICPACHWYFPETEDGNLCACCFDEWLDWPDTAPEMDYSTTEAQHRSQMRFASQQFKGERFPIYHYKE